MTYEPRSRYEYGDDPTAADEARDHALAHARGARLATITDAIVRALDAAGILPYRDDTPVAIFNVLADLFYGNAAIDVPTLQRDPEGGAHV
jgi:hypothetical protein